MTEIKFYDIDCAFLIVDSVAKKAIDHIKNKPFNKNVILDFNHCLLSYELSNIFDAVIGQLEKLEGEKKITIIHTYHEAYEDHLLSYFINNSSKVDYNEFNSLDKVITFLKSRYEITLDFVESKNDK
jgi:hypothetical protein